MRKKKKGTAEHVHQEDVYLPDVAQEEPTLLGTVAAADAEVQIPCSTWCFLMGAGFQGTCWLPQGHDGSHVTGIEIVQEPKARFTIYWELL